MINGVIECHEQFSTALVVIAVGLNILQNYYFVYMCFHVSVDPSTSVELTILEQAS